jgi:phage tail-like protein
MPTKRKNPYSAFNFVVSEVGGANPVAGFMEVSGLDSENAVIEYREGGDNAPQGAYMRKLPGIERYPNVVLRRGITGDLTLWTNYRQKIRDATAGPEFAKDGDTPPQLKIDLQDETHKTVQSWILHNFWVLKLTGPSLNAKGNEIAMEAVEVACERIDPQ